MTDIHNPSSSADPAQAISQLGETMAQTAESHRVLAQEMTAFAKDESLRFMNLRLERNGQVLDKLQNFAGLPGLIGVQQEWLRDLVQDYAGQSMRLMGAMRGLTKNVMASAVETASENIDRMQQEVGDAMNRASDAIDQAGEQMGHVVQETNNYVQETQH
jgi:ElaB/YqjD/DUF883 family membrane-anchored ribosome-binding protein